jgi:hypothetical protein
MKKFVHIGGITSLLLILVFPLFGSKRDFWTDGHAAVMQKNYPLAIQIFSEGVKHHHPASIDYLGWLHLQGLGTPQSPWIAYGYFRQAALLGEDDAGRNLGNMYYSGLGVKQSVEKAKHWWRQSTALGSYRSAMSLATTLFLFGDDEKNKLEAVGIWKGFAKKGDQRALVAQMFAEATLKNQSADFPLSLAKDKSLENVFLPTVRVARMLVDERLDFFIPAKFEMQAKNFCALASTSMLLQHSGKKISQFDLAAHCGEKVWGNGAHWLSMTSAADSHGAQLLVGSFTNDLSGYHKGKEFLINTLRKGKPVVIDILQDGQNSAHSMLLIGYSTAESSFVFLDPAAPFPGFRIIKNDRFQKLWKSLGFIPDNYTAKRPFLAFR